MSVYIVTGTDEGRVSEESLALFEELKPEGSDEFVNEVIEGQADHAEHAHTLAAKVVEGLQTVGFFGGDKVVWLKGATFFGTDRTSEAERAKAGVENILETLQAGLPPGVIFLLSATGLDKRRAFYKWANKNAEMRSYDKIDVSRDGWEEEVAVMVSRVSKEKGLQLTGEALATFVQLAGAETRQISNELEKLDLYLGAERREVTVEDVQVMVPLSHKGVIWEISRALEGRNAPRAIELIDAQLQKNESAIGLVKAAMIPTVRNLFFAKLAIADDRVSASNYQAFQGGLNRLPEEKKALFPKKKDGNVNAWGLFAAAQKARRFTLSHLQKCLEHCLVADKALVTTAQDHRMVLHRLVIQLCAK